MTKFNFKYKRGLWIYEIVKDDGNVMFRSKSLWWVLKRGISTSFKKGKL